MSPSLILIVIGAVLFFAGLLKIGKNQSGGFSLSNFGINIGSTNTQSAKVGNITPGAGGEKKTDWMGFAIAALGLLTAVAGWFKG